LDWYDLYDETSTRPPWAYLFSYLVMIFPAVDVASAFPIGAICLADNIISALHSPKTPIKQVELVLVRSLAVVLPVVFAFFVYDLVSSN
jgi:hypothetical protein